MIYKLRHHSSFSKYKDMSFYVKDTEKNDNVK